MFIQLPKELVIKNKLERNSEFKCRQLDLLASSNTDFNTDSSCDGDEIDDINYVAILGEEF